MALERNVVRWLRTLSYVTLTGLFFLLVTTPKAFAQVDEGSITGTVQDTSGAVVPGAHVTLLNKDQGLTLETVTNSGGAYSFSPVRIGNYEVSATAKGFSKTTQQNLTVNVSQNLLVNIQLKPGAATETVEVTEAPPQLQTEDASVGQTVDEKTVNSLPLNGRNFTFLAQLGAGAQTPQADTRGNAASGAFSANGLRPSQNNYLLDGIDNNSNAVDFLNGTNFAVLPPVDAVAEFKVQTGEFSAELGRSAGAVMNATIKSGTNGFHGAVWEFLRNDKLDAADWFENNGGIKKGELRLNQFGATAGGPIIKNKLFFFGDYEGKRRVQGTVSNGTVPTNQERNSYTSSFVDLSEILTNNASNSPQIDALGRSIPYGTVLDPATTRAVAGGGYVRDPFGLSSCTSAAITLASCPMLNQIPQNRVDPNAIKLLQLYPTPTTSGFGGNFSSSPNLYEHSNSFDTREDFNPSDKDQVFFRFSYVDDPQYIPGIFGGIADGGSFQQGIQTAKSNQSAAAYTHVFSPTIVNVARVGFNHLHTTRFGPEGSVSGLPAQYGIGGIPQATENGGLPTLAINGLATLGSNNFLPSDEVSQTLQVTDDFTRIYGKHSFKMGIEFQHVKFSTLQPAWSRGQFDYNGNYTDVPTKNTGTTGIAQFIVAPVTAPAGFLPSGGSDEVRASNINKTYDEKNYFASYLQDDFKVSPKLTLNLGLRYDYFGPIQESNGGQANFVPQGPPYNAPLYIIPAHGKDNRTLSSTAQNPSLNGNGFLDLLQKDGISLLETDKYGKGLIQVQRANFAPRIGAAFQVTNKLVARGGFGLFYNSFENQGYGPNIGENYPFVFNFDYTPQGPDQEVAPVSINTPYANCATAGANQSATLEAGFTCISLDPTQVNASGLGLQGLQFNYSTPLTFSTNATLQYAINRTLSLQAAYVLTKGMHLQTGVGTNNVSTILPAGASTTNAVPFPDFGHGSSYHTTVGDSIYNGLQTKLEEQYQNGLSFLLAYTWSKTLSDAGDLLNGGSSGGYRAPDVVGLGPGFDRGLADFDIRNVLHFSGGYELPFGKNKQFLNHSNRLVDTVVGGWSTNWIVTLQGGQPITLGCPNGTTSGTSCDDVKVSGQSQELKLHPEVINGQKYQVWFHNPAAFQQPCLLGADAASQPAGCITPSTTFGYLGGNISTVTGVGFHRLDFSAFKAFQLTERFSMQFRAEFFNILNHPNFNNPGFGGNGVVSIGGSTNFNSPYFGAVGSTRDAPFDPRQIQFALKLYY